MHTRAKAKGKRGSRYREPSAAEVAVLSLLSEQGAIPLDQLARFLGADLGEAMALVGGLQAAGCLKYRRFLVADYPWFWPSYRGLQFAATGFGAKTPALWGLAHRRAVNEVRLYLRERAPQGRWICERKVKRIRDPRDHLPDAIFEIGAERHAIEVELSRKSPLEIGQIIAEHSERYDAVIYFCGPKTHASMKRVKAEGCWPTLRIQQLPE